MFTYVLFNAI